MNAPDSLTSDERLPFPDVDRIWLWKDSHHYTQVAYEQPPPHLPSAEFVRADYSWKQLMKRATSDDGVDIEVLVKRQARRITDLERERDWYKNAARTNLNTVMEMQSAGKSEVQK